MLPDKEIKAIYRPKFWAEPDKFYATAVLKSEGFHRNICKECKKPFWNLDSKRTVCGDPSCSPGESFAFIGKTPAKRALSYVDTWKEFSKMFKSFGYTPVKRYPVVSRWNPTMEYTNASIAAFQPFVISGEVAPPANPLVIPQFCMRFGDIDNVGITQSHMTGFVMIGQHMFVPPQKWDQNKVFRDIFSWLKDGIKVPPEEITFHEDAWAGGGNLGCCMEFFSRGCEIGNQVYMLYEQTNTGVEELKLKVLDMGMGMERSAWFSQGSNTIYEATFPDTLSKLLKKTGVKYDKDLMRKFVPHAGRLNVDEVADMQAAWEDVAKRVGVSVKELKEAILPMSGIFSVAEHSRSLLFALNDGALPSNVGGGYNLRILARRALSFIEHYKWNVTIPEVCRWHAAELKPIFPELSEHLDDVQKILDVEKAKYEAGRQKSRQIVERIANEDVTADKLVELYDSHGIAPELIEEEAKKKGRTIKIPDNFYALVSAKHEGEKKELMDVGEKLPLEGVPDSKQLYWDDWKKDSFKAKVIKIIGKHVLLDLTYFYPTSGGQEFDFGTIKSGSHQYNIVDIFKQGPHIVHLLDKEPEFFEGQEVECKIDKERRMQLTQHHTATHILNAAARRILGNHINQAGAKKSVDKAHLDITHYESLTDDQLHKIEDEANKIIKEDIPVHKSLVPRDKAEKEYGMAIYQGGAVPGKAIRIVAIPEVDVEACGGTHLDSTKEAQEIKILKSQKIQDGVVRLTFVAGPAAKKIKKEASGALDEVAASLGCTPKQVPGRCAELFDKWKSAGKAAKKGQPLTAKDVVLASTEETDVDILHTAAQILKTQPEHMIKTIQRFQKDIKGWIK
ncbi:MAG: alanine--tRNA ligase [Nanoarchaeota archaeon]